MMVDLDPVNCGQVMQAYGRTAVHLRRLVEPIYAFQRAGGAVAILCSLTSVGYDARHLDELRAAYEGTFFLDTKTLFVTEPTVLTGALDGLKVLILPQTSHVPRPVVEQVTEWVRAGGLLLAIGPRFTQDEAQRASDTALADIPMGKGRIITRAAPQDWDEYHRMGDRILTEAGVRRPIRAVGDQRRPVTGIELRATVRDGRRLVYLINMRSTGKCMATAAGRRDIMTR